jgi:murein DD-endopeptidase MepM/ murein hydrolase activator NlpD
VTTYSHLRGIASGLRPGMHVRQGQVIGYVGQTGLATGPHLHFALFRNQQYINPLTARVTLRRSVRDLARFQLAKQTLLTQLVSVPLPAPSGPVEPVTVAGLLPWLRPGVVTLTR